MLASKNLACFGYTRNMTNVDDDVEGTQEKSELFRYFKEIGIVDSEELNGSIIFANDLSEKKLTKFSTAYRRQYLNLVYLRRLLNCEDASYLHAAVESILESMLMMREDSYHVEYVMSQAKREHCHNRSPPVEHHVPILLFAAICIFYGLPMKFVYGIVILIATVFTVGYIWRKCHALSMKRNVNKVRQLLFLQNELILLVKKSLCLLRARSSNTSDQAIYTPRSFFQSSHLDKSMFLEQFSTIPVLRNCLVETLLSMTKYLHSVTKNLIETVPLLSQVDNTECYVCNCNWSELGLEELSQNCNGRITLEILQRLTSFYIIIQSEFLRRFSLSLHPETWLKCNRKVSNSLWAAIEDASWETTRNNFRLAKHYWLYCGYQKQSNVSSKEFKPKHVLCHNIDLFQTLQEWFLVIQEISNDVSFCIKQIESQSIGESDDKNFESRYCEMLKVMVELGALLKKSNSHYEICFRKLEKCNTSSIQAKQERSVFVQENENENENCEITPVEYNQNAEVEDEVFEDVAFCDVHTEDEELDSAMIVEETENKIRKKHYTMLFLELKNALVDRAQQIQEREAKALRKKKIQVPKCVDSLLLSDNSNCVPDTEQSSDKILCNDQKELCPNETVSSYVGESQTDLYNKLSGIHDSVGYAKANSVFNTALAGSSEVIHVIEQCNANKNSDFETTALKFSSVSKTSEGSKCENMCASNNKEKLCESGAVSDEDASLCKLHPFTSDCGEEEMGENCPPLQSSLVTELAIKAAAVTSAAQQTKLSVFPLDTETQKLNIGNILSFAQNATQLIEETFMYDPDENS